MVATDETIAEGSDEDEADVKDGQLDGKHHGDLLVTLAHNGSCYYAHGFGAGLCEAAFDFFIQHQSGNKALAQSVIAKLQRYVDTYEYNAKSKMH